MLVAREPATRFVGALPLSYTDALTPVAGIEPATTSVPCEVTVVFTTGPMQQSPVVSKERTVREHADTDGLAPMRIRTSQPEGRFA